MTTIITDQLLHNQAYLAWLSPTHNSSPTQNQTFTDMVKSLQGVWEAGQAREVGGHAPARRQEGAYWFSVAAGAPERVTHQRLRAQCAPSLRPRGLILAS